ncbi:MAG: alcohol dehydrogenase catalytic domain-containing protein [Thermodesulfobacteriota bacterium]
MNGLWLEHRKLAFRSDVPVPAGRTEALVRVRLAGICGTDLELLKGYYPFAGIPGHEFVGEVVGLPETVGSDPANRDWIGRRVVGEINVGCGGCSLCQRGMHKHCASRTVLGIVNRNGVFAEYVRLPLENLHPVPDEVCDEAAVFTEPLAAALEIQEQLQLRPTDRILLIGAGRLGLLIAQALRHSGSDLRILARYPEQRRILSAFGIQEIEEGEIGRCRWDVVIEATGSSRGFDLAVEAVRPQGTLVVKSTYTGALTLDMSRLVVNEVTIVGSRCGPFAPALRLLGSKAVDPIPLIADIYRLEDGLAAFEAAAKPGMLKVLLRPL